MGGGGGGGSYHSLSPDVEKKIQEARAQVSERLNSEVNAYLDEVLAEYNGRDVELTNTRLDEIIAAIKAVDIERVLLGGSVAKHTDVDGLSDVDALIVLDRNDLGEMSPAEVRGRVYAELDAKLSRAEVAEVRAGSMAITVVYTDGMEIQLVPVLKSGTRVMIGTYRGTDWVGINLKRFHAALTSANQKLNSALVPAIKLLKSINADLPVQKQLRSYHIEALAVDCARAYDGPMVPREVLIHLCNHSAKRVLRPMQDVSGQSAYVDEYLGDSQSVQRRVAAQALAGIARRLESASAVEDWKAVLE